MKRRKFLASTIGIGITSTAGCLDFGSSNNRREYEGNYGHPSGNDISSQPYIGPKPSNSNSLIVGFEDPACPVCASFHKNALQDLRDKHIESGNLTFVYRGIDVVYDWGTRPLQIQEKVNSVEGNEKSMELINEYYKRQRNINSNNVMDKSRTILNSIGLNAGEYLPIGDEKESLVQEDFTASNKSNVSGTPTFYLFSDKDYETKIVGAKSASVYESVLNL